MTTQKGTISATEKLKETIYFLQEAEERHLVLATRFSEEIKRHKAILDKYKEISRKQAERIAISNAIINKKNYEAHR